MDANIFFTIVVCLLITYLLKKILLWRKLPPGPFGLPIIGYVPFLSRKPHLKLEKLAKKYGNIFSISLGSCNVIILNDFQSTKEVFAKDAFMGRPRDFVFDYNTETLDTEAFIGLAWKDHRRFSLHMLKDLGLGKSKIEVFIQEEISELLDNLKQNVGKPYTIYQMLASSMSNIISYLIFGKLLPYDDPARQMTIRVLQESTATASQAAWEQFFPWVKQILQFFGIGHIRKLKETQQELRDYIMREIIEHEKTFDPNNIRDYVDGYLLESQRSKIPSFCKPVIQDISLIFFGAGSETVRTTVEWLLLTTAAHQDFQQRIHLEIDETVRKDEFITFAHRKSMPFTEAFINEVLRWCTIVPLNLLRYSLADGKLNGYFIPKGTYIINNLYAIHHNPEYWGLDAHEFRPERFLTEDGKSVKKWEHFIPFSIGKRACPGEPLAKVEVFMYFTSILQKFHVRLPQGNVPDFEGVFGATFVPKPQNIIYSIRS